MGHMKDFDIRIRNGGDDAIAAACELAGIANERRGYEDTMKATGDITDIVTVLRGVGFSSVSPHAGDSASLLHYCVTHAADEIEHLRERQRWIPVSEQWPKHLSDVLVAYKCGKYIRLGVGEFDGTTVNDDGLTIPYFKGIGGFEVTHWMSLPEPPEA